MLEHYKDKIEKSDITTKLELKKNDYFLLTIHRAKNADHKDRRLEKIKSLNLVVEIYKKRLFCSIHPGTKSRIDRIPSIETHPLVEFHEHCFFDFVNLEKNVLSVLTESCTV